MEPKITKQPPALAQSLCAVIDVLGFSEVVLRSYRDNTQHAVILDLFNALNESLARITSAGRRLNRLSVRVLTDNVIVTYELGHQSQFMDLCHLCEMLSDYQYLMARKGYFVRGGIASGTIAIDDQMVFGDALIHAHRLEKQFAKNPRIMIHQELAREINDAFAAEPEPSQNQWMSVVMKDVDGQLFINYLSETEQPVLSKGRVLEVDEKMLSDHGVQVLRHLQETKARPEIWSKYFWAANYHNAFCDRKGKGALKIDSLHLQAQPMAVRRSSRNGVEIFEG